MSSTENALQKTPEDPFPTGRITSPPPSLLNLSKCSETPLKGAEREAFKVTPNRQRGRLHHPLYLRRLQGGGKGEVGAGAGGKDLVESLAKTLKSSPSPAEGKALCIGTESSNVTVYMGIEAKASIFFFIFLFLGPCNQPCNPFREVALG